MPTNEELEQDQLVKDQPVAADLETKTEEIPSEDADTISGGWEKQNGGEF
jgi:hypothetical protein